MALDRTMIVLFNSMQEIVLKKPIVAQLVQKFPTFYGTRRFIAVFRKASHWTLS
jgi:hypothetical protein